MSDSNNLDLTGLQPEEVPDQAAKAIRRFRWRVALLGVLVIVVGGSIAIVGGLLALKQVRQVQLDQELAREAANWPPSRFAIQEGHNCTTPSYDVQGARITILGVLEYPTQSWLHLLVESKGQPLSREVGDSESWLHFDPQVPGARPQDVLAATPQWTSGEAYVIVPSSLRRYRVAVVGASGEDLGSISIDLDKLLCPAS